jgi:hypothetical protein
MGICRAGNMTGVGKTRNVCRILVRIYVGKQLSRRPRWGW